MYNTFLYNGGYYGENLPFVIEVQQGEVIYNGFVLHKTDTCHLSFFGGKDGARIELNNYDLPNSLGSANNSSFSRENSFIVRGRLKGSNREHLRELQDTLKGFMNEQGKRMQVSFAGDLRRANAHVTSLTFEEQHYTIDSVPFEIGFTILQGYWEAIVLTSVSFTAINTTFTEEIINNSTFLESYPVWNVTFASATGVDEFNINIGGNEITINESITDADILIIDTREQTVELNGTPIDFSGTFPILMKGNNSFTITANGTYEYSLSINYRKTYY